MMTIADPQSEHGSDHDQRARREAYDALLARLSRQSVAKRYEAFRDVDWDAPEMHIDPEDPRWQLGVEDALGATAWYRAQLPGRRARIGLARVAELAKVGMQFENVLSRGLLELTFARDEHDPEQRYAYHELIEESQHSLMFAEFVRRSGACVDGLGKIWSWLGGVVARLGRSFPELFFVFVLGGEEPIDHNQRAALRGDSEMHPLLRRISQIHVTEEARHLCFARSFLKEHVPRLSRRRRFALSLLAPGILRLTAELMMRPPHSLARELGVPPEVLRTAARDPRQRAATLGSFAEVRQLCDELGLITPLTAPLWRGLGAA
jgi:hypothetical protein